MSTYSIIEDDDNLTTDAVADAPRENIKEASPIIEEPDKNEQSSEESTQNNKTSIGYSINAKKKIPSGNSANAKPRKKSSNGYTKPTHASTRVINVVNSSGIHIGAVNTYNLLSKSQKTQKTNNNQQKENIVRTAAVDRIFASEELVKSEHIDFVSTHLGDGWRDVGENLGYSKGQMDHFYADNKNAGHKEVVYQMLLDWIRVKPNDSKIRVLAGALWDADEKDVVCRWTKNF